MKYKEIIEKRKTISLAEEGEKYYLENSKDEYVSINNQHDKIFRNILNNKQEAANFINKSLKLKKKIEAEQLEKYNTSFITQELENRESDVIYKIKDKNIFILIEHQTKIDYKMPYRILEYEYEIMKSALDYKKLGQKEYKLPLIISIVLYTGRKKWNAKKYIEEVQEKLEGYEEIEFTKYDVIDVNDFSNKELIEDKSFLSKAMLIEKAKDNEEIIRYLDEIIIEMNENEEIYTDEIKQIFIIMIDKILKIKIGEEKAKEFIRNIKKGKGGKEKMMTVFETIEQDNKRIYRRGIRQGERNGRIEIAKKLLKKNFSIEEVEEITGLNKKYIKGN